MSLSKLSLLPVLLFTIGIQTVLAQDPDKRGGVGLHGSAIKLLLGNRGDGGLNYLGGLTVFYGINQYWTINLHGGYGLAKPRDPVLSATYRTRILPFTLSLDYVLVPFAEVRPYFTFGAGVFNWDVRRRLIESDSEESVYGLRSRPELVLGFGLEKVIGDRFSTSFHVRYNHVFKGNEDTIGTGDDDRAMAEIGVTIKMWSPYEGDSDGDGVPKGLDQCLNAVEDYDGFEDLDGCPDPDNDQDGVLDYDDNCREIAEDIDGFEDLDGCPDFDNDLDGIADVNDVCPDFREDIDGFEDLDGCPEPDNDLDGILDLADNCPDQAEIFNNFEDEDGCPDVVAERIARGETIMLQGINFHFDSANILPESASILQMVIQALLSNSEISVEIRGYTDASGNPNYNLALSQRRADAVRQYLIERGVPEERLRAIGFGEKNPIASNDTAEGQGKNRRVEFVPSEPEN